jgi:hypothetical protein
MFEQKREWHFFCSAECRSKHYARQKKEYEMLGRKAKAAMRRDLFAA